LERILILILGTLCYVLLYLIEESTLRKMMNHPSFHKEKKPLSHRLVYPIQEFMAIEAAGGILLLVATLFALFWANSQWHTAYEALWETNLAFEWGSFRLSRPLHEWINDGLMSVFFFAVGLEIKREILLGELSSLRKACFPIVAAVGGMVIPAGFYLFFNHGTPEARGWGIPMATDIAFSLGVLTLFGKKIPPSLKIFLAALAIADDIGAVLVIAFFYTSHISWTSLGLGSGFLLLLILLNRSGVRHPLPYALLGIGGVWLAFLFSGVHATIAGVLAAFTIPARTLIHPKEFLKNSRNLLDTLEKSTGTSEGVMTNAEQQSILDEIEDHCEWVQTPLQRIEEKLHPWVTFVILPLFALANAGIYFEGPIGSAISSPVTLGIFLGLVLGKPLGIFLFSWLGVGLGIARLPNGVQWGHVFGVSLLGGIGFTMSLFIASLAFKDFSHLLASKLGILCASFLSGLLGYLFLYVKIGKKNLHVNKSS
jgi:NhaA family Na+:H+ antiporter